MDTSKQSYQEALDNGIIARRQREVLNLVRAAGKITGRAVSRAIPGGHKRLAELKSRGILTDDEIGRDPITGKEVKLWKVSGQMPMLKSSEKKMTRQQMMDMIEMLVLIITSTKLGIAEYNRGYQDGYNQGIEDTEEEAQYRD